MAAMRAALAITVLLLAGCGGGSSRADFVADATEICTKANERVKALGAPESFPETQLYARQAKDAVGDQIADLSDLAAPAELDDAYAQYLVTLDERRQQLDRLAVAADGNSMRAIQQVGSDMDVITAKARTQARAAGIAECEAG
jgi:hypothetical protein